MELVLPLSRPRWQSRIFCSRWCTVLYCTVLYCTVLYCTVPAAGDGSPARSSPAAPAPAARKAATRSCRARQDFSINATKICFDSNKYLCAWYLRLAPAMCQPDSVLLLAPEPCLLLSPGLLNSDLLLLASWGPWTRCRRSMVAAVSTVASNCNQWVVICNKVTKLHEDWAAGHSTRYYGALA